MFKKMLNVDYRAMVLGGLLLCSSASWAEWYMDVTYSLNQAGLEGDGDRYGVITELEVDNQSSGFQITGGFSFNEYLDLEFGYVDFGTQSSQVNLNTALLDDFNPFEPGIGTLEPLTAAPLPLQPYNPGSGFVSLPSLPTGTLLFLDASQDIPLGPIAGSKLEAKMRGIRLAAVGKVPLSSWFNLNVQAGALIPEYKVTTNNYVLQLQEGACCFYDQVLVKDTETSHDVELFMGLGLTWHINDSISSKLFWEKYLDYGEGEYLEQDLDSYNLSLRYRF